MYNWGLKKFLKENNHSTSSTKQWSGWPRKTEEPMNILKHIQEFNSCTTTRGKNPSIFDDMPVRTVAWQIQKLRYKSMGALSKKSHWQILKRVWELSLPTSIPCIMAIFYRDLYVNWGCDPFDLRHIELTVKYSIQSWYEAASQREFMQSSKA